MPRKLSELAELMNDPIGQINEILVGTNLFRQAELEREPVNVPSQEYADAFDMLEAVAENVDIDGKYQAAIPIATAADLIADNYDKRVL